MNGGWWSRLFQTRSERYVATLSSAVQRLGWTAAPGEDVSVVFSGRASDGSEFTIRASLFDDGDDTHDMIEWRAGPLCLNDLVLAISNNRASGRDWLRRIQVPGGLKHEGSDPGAAHEALNAAAAAGMPLKELNAYGLHLGLGGSDGVVIRFQRSAVEVAAPAPAGRRLMVLAASVEAAAHLIAGPVPDLLASVVNGAYVHSGATFEVFAGVPFSKLLVEMRWTNAEQLQAIAELGAALRARALSYSPGG